MKGPGTQWVVSDWHEPEYSFADGILVFSVTKGIYTLRGNLNKEGVGQKRKEEATIMSPTLQFSH